MARENGGDYGLIWIKVTFVVWHTTFHERAFQKEAAMGRLAMILFSMISTTLMGVGIVVVLTMGLDTLKPILMGAAAGLVLSIPVTYVVAKKIAALS